MKKKTIVIMIVVIAAAVVLSVALLVPAFAQEPAEEPVSTVEPSEAPAREQVEEEVPEETTEPEEAAPTPEPPATPEPVQRPDMASEEVAYTEDTVEYTYYDVASDSERTARAEVAEDSSLAYGLEVVSQQLWGLPLAESPINPNSISLEDGNLYIDFSASIYDIQAGIEGEDAILESVADAYLNNLPDVRAVYYSVDGGNYSSGHFSVPGDIPYKAR